jgi:hypothetical protein
MASLSRIRWSSLGRPIAAALAMIVAIALLPGLLAAPEPPPLPADIGLPRGSAAVNLDASRRPLLRSAPDPGRPRVDRRPGERLGRRAPERDRDRPEPPPDTPAPAARAAGAPAPAAPPAPVPEPIPPPPPQPAVSLPPPPPPAPVAAPTAAPAPEDSRPPPDEFGFEH